MGDISDRSIEGYISILRHWTKPWNMRAAADIGRVDGRELVKRMTEAQRSRRYIKKVINLIDKVYLWGIEEGRIYGTEAPCKKIHLGKIESKTPEILSLEEIKKLLNAAQVTDNKWYPIWAMALLTGMRSGELQALNWDQIDLSKKTIIVDRSYDSNTKSVGSTKGRYWRTVPISSDLNNLLNDIQANTQVEGGFVLPRLKEWENGDQAVSLRSFLKSIGLKDVKFHALRACWATQMLASGVPAAIVMKIGGWKKMATLDIYVRLAGVEIQGATDCLNFVPDKIDYSENVIDFSSFKER